MANRTALEAAWNKLRAQYKAADEARDVYDRKLHAQHGPYRESWLSSTEKKKLQALTDKRSKVSDRMYEWLANNSQWNWTQGVATSWVHSKLTAHDALSSSLPELPGESNSYGFNMSTGAVLSRNTHAAEHDTREKVKEFNTAYLRTAKLLDSFRDGKEDEKAITNAFNKLYKMQDKLRAYSSEEAILASNRIDALRSDLPEARESHARRRSDARHAEHARLSQEIRDAAPRGYEKELALMRGGRT